MELNIKQAIEELDYENLITNETNEYRKQALIELYFDSKRKKKVLYGKEQDKFIAKEMRDNKRYWSKQSDIPEHVKEILKGWG